MHNPLESQLPPASPGDVVQNSVQKSRPAPKLVANSGDRNVQFGDLLDLKTVVIHAGGKVSWDSESRKVWQRAHNEAGQKANPVDFEREPEQSLVVMHKQLDEGGKLFQMADKDVTRKVIIHQHGELPRVKLFRLVNAIRLQAPDAEIWKGSLGRTATPWGGLVEVAEVSVAAPSVDPVALAKMAPSELGRLLGGELGTTAVCRESGILYRYDGGAWSAVADSAMASMLARIFEDAGCPYGAKKLNGAVETMKVRLPEMGEPAQGLVGFANGVYDLKAGWFRPHSADDYLPSHNGIVYGEAEPGETLVDHAPAFTRWINHAAGGSVAKMMAIKAALYMVLANRYDWQLFLEVTGEGGSGKSVMANLCELLVGRENVGSTSMEAMKGAFGLENVWDKRLVLLPDQSQYIGDGALLKAITGGDEVAINRKGKAMFGAKVRAVVLATNNEPMRMTERNGGISRRRVIFPFNNVVAEADRDPDLGRKIAGELPVIIRHLLTVFANPGDAKALLVAQRDGEEALAVKQESDPVIAMCELFDFLADASGLRMGGGAAAVDPRSNLYHFYELYLKHIGADRALQLIQFGKAMRQGAKAYGKEYKTRKSNGQTITNVKLKQEADAIMPPGQYRLPH